MCGRYVSATPPDLLIRIFEASGDDTLEAAPSYNVAPTMPVPVVVSSGGARTLEIMRWGLVPPWAPDPSVGSRMINARRETLGDKSAFRPSLARRRALIPADAYYEWHVAHPGAAKQPYAITAADGDQLAFAGLWETWVGAEDTPLLTCTIVTTGSSGSVSHLHDRMPVILPRDMWDEWLRVDVCDAAAALSLLDAVPVPALRAHPVSTRVNDVRVDDSELLTEVAPAPVHEQLDLLA
jgi:putative SOS response-associated peptidase YedK